MIRVQSFAPPEWNLREIMRYARIRGADESYRELMADCMREAEPTLSYRVCYTLLDTAKNKEELQLGSIRTTSDTVRKAIRSADQVLLFAATVGAPFDLLIRKYTAVAPSRALIMQAIGAERVESLCDTFCRQMNAELNNCKKCLTPRVSPGYGDIPLTMQKDIFAVLDCPRKIGLTLDESLLMSPSKSVTALCGVIDPEQREERSKCSACGKTDCLYRTEENR